MDRYIIGKYLPENCKATAARRPRLQFSKTYKRMNFAKPYRIIMNHLNLCRNTGIEINFGNPYL